MATSRCRYRLAKYSISLERSFDPAGERSIKSPLIAKLARALVEAIHVYKIDRESMLKIISKYTQITDPEPCILSSSQNLVYFMDKE